MGQQKRILICPLDWGLGHATRCIPVIRLLLEKNAEVYIAAERRPLALLRREFPGLTFIPFRGYDISYPRSGSMALKMLLSLPALLKGIKREYTELQQIVDRYKIDVVISDNRYGCHTKKAKSIFITHQLMVKTPLFEKAVHKKILAYIKNYDECWIPDTAGSSNLSGDLSHKYPLPEHAYYTGPLSRFEKNETRDIPQDHDILAVISGPEPQRSLFEQLVLQQLYKHDLKAMVISGLPEEIRTEQHAGVKTVTHLDAAEMQRALAGARLVIARSGYSTVMDLAALGKKAVFIPTPGQTEQEYLAAALMKKKIAFCQQQSSFDLGKAIKESELYSGFETTERSAGLEDRINLLL